jgi:hypothetical protein
MQWDKKRISNIIYAFLLIIIFPIVAFNVLNVILSHIGSQTLDQTIYVIATMAGFSTICFKVNADIIKSTRSWSIRIFSTLVFLAVFPLIEIFTLNFISPFQLLPIHVAKAGFGYLFGIVLWIAFEWIKPIKRTTG